MLKILILGGNSYLGSKLLEHLQNKKMNLSCSVRQFDYKLITNLQCFAYSVPSSMKVKYFHGEELDVIVGNISEIKYYLGQHKVDWIVNCVGTYQRGQKTLVDIIESNLSYAVQSLNLALEFNVENYLYINTALSKEINQYSYTKKCFGEIGRYFAQKGYINFINVMLEMYYGKKEPSDRFLPFCIEKMKRNEDIELTAGTQRRDIIYIEDVCNALEVIMKSRLSGYNEIPLGTGEGPTIRELIEYISRELASESRLHFGAVPMREGERDSVADIAKINQLGYQIHYPWKEGIKEIL